MRSSPASACSGSCPPTVRVGRYSSNSLVRHRKAGLQLPTSLLSGLGSPPLPRGRGVAEEAGPSEQDHHAEIAVEQRRAEARRETGTGRPHCVRQGSSGRANRKRFSVGSRACGSPSRSMPGRPEWAARPVPLRSPLLRELRVEKRQVSAARLANQLPPNSQPPTPKIGVIGNWKLGVGSWELEVGSLRNQRPDPAVLPRRHKQLAVATLADVEISAWNRRAHRLVDQFG